MATQSKTGKAGSITIGGNVVPITKWSAKIEVDFADSTDSGNYSAPNLPKSQLPGAYQVTGSIELYYDAATTSTNITSNVKNPSNGPYALVLKLDASTTYFSGNADITDSEFTVEVPGATMVSGTANWKSNGSFTLN